MMRNKIETSYNSISIRTLIFFIVCLFFSNISLSQGNKSQQLEDETDEAKILSKKYAAGQAARKTVKKLKDKKIDVTVAYSNMILNNIGKHTGKSKSKNLLGNNYKNDLRKSFTEDIKLIHDSFNKHKEWFSLDWLITDYVNNKFDTEIENNISANYKNNFDKIFRDARNLAVQDQLSQLSLSVELSYEDVEDYFRSKWSNKKQNSIRQKLMRQMKNNQSLLEENEQRIRVIADEMIQNGREQCEDQLRVVNEMRSVVGITANQIANSLTKGIQNAINEWKRLSGGDQKIYPIFSGVKKAIESKSQILERAKFQEYCESYDYNINKRTLKNYIKNEPTRHRSAKKSLVLCTKKLFPDVVKNVVNDYSIRISSFSKRSKFKTRLQQLISNQNIRSTLKQRISTALKYPLLDSPFQIVRANIANQQLQKYFPLVASGKWSVPENILKQIYKEEFGVSSFEECTKLPFINRDGESYTRNILFEETENKVLSKIIKLLEEGKNAWNGQISIANVLEDKIKKEIMSNPYKRQVGEWIAYYTQHVKKDWNKKRIEKIWRGFTSPPSYAAIKYVPLFGYIENIIRDRVKANYEVAKKEKKAELERKKREEEERQKQAELEQKRREEEERRKQELERQKEEQEKNKGGMKSGPSFQPSKAPGTAVSGGKQSVETKEAGGKSSTPGEGKVDAIRSLLFLFLIILLILLLILIAILLWKSLRGNTFYVRDIDESVAFFSDHMGIKPKIKSEREAIFKIGLFNKIVLKKA